MNPRIRRVFKIAGVYIAVILGAGFASGQEIMRFFVDYGKAGFLGILVSSLLFALTGWAVLSICRRQKAGGYRGFMELVMGRRLAGFFEVVFGLFMFILFSTMLAAAGATMQEAFSMPYTIGVCAVAGMCFIAFLFGMEGIVSINAFLSPVMIIGSVYMGLYLLVFSTAPAFNSSEAGFLNAGGNWLLSALIYVSYNIITAITVLTNMRDGADSNKTARQAGILSGIIMGLLGLSVALPIYVNYSAVSSLEIPLLALVHKNNILMEYLYLIVLLCAVFSSAATNGYATANWLCQRFGFHRHTMNIGITIMGVTAAYAGFSNFVTNVYPVFAIAGFLEIVLIGAFFLRYRK